MTRFDRTHWVVLAMAAAVVALALSSAGCATSRPGRVPKPAGFLSDYDRLVPGEGTQAERVWVRPDVAWADYDAILLDPVTIWRGTEARSRGLSGEDAQMLADAFYELIRERVSPHWRIATEPGPRTLRVQTALTKIDEKNLAIDVVSSVVPQARGLNTVQSMATKTFFFTGQAAIEARISDASSGQILVEGLDHRVGKLLMTPDQLRTWGDVLGIFEYWTDRSVHNLCTVQGREGCPPAPPLR